MTYSEKLKDPRWQRKRLEILNRADFTCQGCYQEKHLHVHHTFYMKDMEPWEYPDDSLLALCDDCHRIRQEFEKRLLRALAQLPDLEFFFSFVDLIEKVAHDGTLLNFRMALERMVPKFLADMKEAKELQASFLTLEVSDVC